MTPSPGDPGRVRSTWRLLLKEVGAFGVVGAVCFVVDLGLFQVLYAHAHWDAVLAKVACTVVSTALAYLGHRFWSFSHREQVAPRRAVLFFAVINGGALLLGAGIVALVRYPLHQHSVVVIQIANVVSIALGSLLRWLTYRRWVFTVPEAAGVAAAPPHAPRLPSASSSLV